MRPGGRCCWPLSCKGAQGAEVVLGPLIVRCRAMKQGRDARACVCGWAVLRSLWRHHLLFSSHAALLPPLLDPPTSAPSLAPPSRGARTRNPAYAHMHTCTHTRSLRVHGDHGSVSEHTAPHSKYTHTRKTQAQVGEQRRTTPTHPTPSFPFSPPPPSPSTQIDPLRVSECSAHLSHSSTPHPTQPPSLASVTGRGRQRVAAWFR